MPADVAANFTIVTLGVADLGRSATFYRDLGWEQRGDPAQGIVWFKTSGSWVGLFDHTRLAEDAGLEPTPQHELPSFRGTTMALNLVSEDAVDLAMARFLAAGAAIVKPAARAEWGGYSGYVADLDGHVWEIAHAPGFTVDENGRIEIGPGD